MYVNILLIRCIDVTSRVALLDNLLISQNAPILSDSPSYRCIFSSVTSSARWLWTLLTSTRWVTGWSHAHTNDDWFSDTVYPKEYAHGFCFAVLCCGYTMTDFPISIRLTSLALWQSNDCPVPAKRPWWIWINTSCEFIMNDCITTTKQSTTKPCASFLGYTVCAQMSKPWSTEH